MSLAFQIVCIAQYQPSHFIFICHATNQYVICKFYQQCVYTFFQITDDKIEYLWAGDLLGPNTPLLAANVSIAAMFWDQIGYFLPILFQFMSWELY